MKRTKIITFYRFKPLADLDSIKDELIEAMRRHSILGTIIIADEGYNATVSGPEPEIGPFIDRIGEILGGAISSKSSFHDRDPFRRRFVKIKPEIVTLRKKVDVSLGEGTHVSAGEWNGLLKRDDVYVLDTRNDYEYRVGTFEGAVNPGTGKFSDLAGFVDSNLDPAVHRNIAMFCTGGIRCEKFAPYMKQLGFENVFQLEGGILKYLETIPESESLWRGECFVFDDRISVDPELKKGRAPDLSAELKGRK